MAELLTDGMGKRRKIKSSLPC